ncbi:MAG: iron uptake protein [Thermomonas sp.]
MSRAHAKPPASGALRLAARIVAAMVGGYAFAWGLIAAGMSLLFAAGMEFHDAEFLATAFGVLAFLVAFLWAFAARRISLVWAVLFGGGAVFAGIGSLVQSLLA